MQRELGTTMDLIIDRVERAEGLARALELEIDTLISDFAEAARLSHQLSGRATPIPLAPTEVETRLGCRLAAILGKNRHRLGAALEFRTSHFKHSDDWKRAEQALLLRHVEPLLNDAE